METNYYLHERPDCDCCGRPFEPLHIGKISSGWCFSLHVMPDDNINTLDDWRALWGKEGAFIRNEYGEKIPISEMERIITTREWRGDIPTRHDIDGRHCIGHGSGNVRLEWEVVLPTGGANPLYTVRRCRKTTDVLFGSVHGSMDATKTICGLDIDSGKWWILTNAFDGKVTCRKCLREA